MPSEKFDKLSLHSKAFVMSSEFLLLSNIWMEKQKGPYYKDNPASS